MFINAYHVLSICQSQLGLEFDRLPCLTLSILTTCASAQRVPRMNVLKYDTIWYLLCSFIENQSISNKTVGFDKCNTHLSLGMFFLDSFSPRSKSPSLHHISAGKDPQPTGINRPFLAAPRLDRGCPHGNPCPFSSRAAGKAGRSASKVWRKVGELQLQFWLRYQYAIQYMI